MEGCGALLAVLLRPVSQQDGFSFPDQLIGLGEGKPQIGPRKPRFLNSTGWRARTHP
jgi:hypothetical protein